jgi:hypothetical protein
MLIDKGRSKWPPLSVSKAGNTNMAKHAETQMPSGRTELDNIKALALSRLM